MPVAVKPAHEKKKKKKKPSPALAAFRPALAEAGHARKFEVRQGKIEIDDPLASRRWRKHTPPVPAYFSKARTQIP